MCYMSSILVMGLLQVPAKSSASWLTMGMWAQLGKDAGASMLGMPAVIKHLAIVVVQDALELVDAFPDQPLIRRAIWSGCIHSYSE